MKRKRLQQSPASVLTRSLFTHDLHLLFPPIFFPFLFLVHSDSPWSFLLPAFIPSHKSPKLHSLSQLPSDILWEVCYFNETQDSLRWVFFLLSIIWSSSQVQSFQLNLSSITLKQFLVVTFPSASWECQCLVVFVRICASVCLTDCLSCVCLLCCIAISKITLKLELSGLLVAFLAIEC